MKGGGQAAPSPSGVRGQLRAGGRERKKLSEPGQKEEKHAPGPRRPLRALQPSPALWVPGSPSPAVPGQAGAGLFLLMGQPDPSLHIPPLAQSRKQLLPSPSPTDAQSSRVRGPAQSPKEKEDEVGGARVARQLGARSDSPSTRSGMAGERSPALATCQNLGGRSTSSPALSPAGA